MMKTLFCAAAAALLLAGPALAQAPAGPVAGPYAAVFAGGGFATSTRLSAGPIDDRLRYDTGPVFGLAGGWRLGNGIRVELEYGYRENGAKPLLGLEAQGHQTIHTVMANAVYELPTGTRFSPYAGIGVGGAFTGGDGLSFGTIAVKTSSTVPAFQGILGVAAAITDGMAVTLDYRYLRTGDLTYRFAPDLADKRAFSSHAVTLGVRVALADLFR